MYNIVEILLMYPSTGLVLWPSQGEQVKHALVLLAHVREVGEQGHPSTCGAHVVNTQSCTARSHVL